MRSRWRTRSNIAFVIFLVIGGYFLWTEHRAHVIEFLPWVLLLACLGMHMFMHGGHGSHEPHDNGEPRDQAADRPER